MMQEDLGVFLADFAKTCVAGAARLSGYWTSPMI